MSDPAENLDNENVVQEQEATNDTDWQAKAQELEQRLNSVLSKHDELLSETKKAKAMKKEADQKELELRRQKEEQAAKNGEYEKLFKQRDKEYQEAVSQIENMRKEYRNEKISTTAMNIANDLADGANAKLLSKFISESLSNLADETGSLGDDVLSSIKNEFKSDETYKALLRSSKAQGGGAPGNTRGAQLDNKLSRDDFYKMSDNERQAYFDKHGKFNIEE